MTSTMKNRHRRNRRWHNLPRPRITLGVKGGLLLLLTFLEGWTVCWTVTHSRLPAPLGTGTPQWMVTGMFLLAVIIPLLWMLTLAIDAEGEDDE